MEVGFLKRPTQKLGSQQLVSESIVEDRWMERLEARSYSTNAHSDACPCLDQIVGNQNNDHAKSSHN